MTQTATPTEKPLRIPSWIITLCCLALVAIGGGLYWMSTSGMEDDLKRARVVQEGRSDAPAESLRECFRGEGKGLIPGSDKVWEDTAGGKRGHNPARHIFIDIQDTQDSRAVRIWTRDGEPLGADDRKQIATCLEG